MPGRTIPGRGPVCDDHGVIHNLLAYLFVNRPALALPALLALTLAALPLMDLILDGDVAEPHRGDDR
jgi:hypothetical protein